MAISYTWTFGPLETKTENDLSDILEIIHWRYSAADGSYYSAIYGTVSLDTPSPSSFISFDSLTKTKIKSWVLEKLNRTEANLKTQLKSNIDNQKTPKRIIKTVPWET